jgi:hypothetical protein
VCLSSKLVYMFVWFAGLQLKVRMSTNSNVPFELVVKVVLLLMGTCFGLLDTVVVHHGE